MLLCVAVVFLPCCALFLLCECDMGVPCVMCECDVCVRCVSVLCECE